MTTLPVIIAATIWASTQSPADRLPRTLDTVPLHGIIVQHDGRWPPLDTLARDVVESVTGRADYLGRNAVLWLLAWTFNPAAWEQEPLLSIRNAELRAELGLPADKTVYSYDELARHERVRSLMAELRRLQAGRKLDPLQLKVRDIEEKLVLLRRIFDGQVIRPIPDAKDGTALWQVIPTGASQETANADPTRLAWLQLRSAFLADDAAAFAAATNQLRTALDGLPAAYRPSAKLTDAELSYNKLRPFRVAWMLMAAGAVLALIATAAGTRWIRSLAVFAFMAGFGVLTYGLSLRWTIAGRIPASNMFESLLFLSWGMGAFAIASMLLIRDRMVPLTATFMGALALFLAESLPLDHYVRPIAPVLMDTVWMSIHVPIIMVSYSVLALASLVAHGRLLVTAVAPTRGAFIEALDRFHYWYVLVGCVLLGAGIATGSMWAASSWGRYWGWDPKEVWSLVAFFAYLAILHQRIDREATPGWIYALGLLLGAAVMIIVSAQLAPRSTLGILGLAAAAGSVLLFAFARGPFAAALKSVLAFWLIIMTYVGVNYVLGIGLHSYGFGTGAVVRYMFLIGGLDLTFVALCTAVVLARRNTPVAPQTA